MGVAPFTRSVSSIADGAAAVQRSRIDGQISGTNGKITVDIGEKFDKISNRLENKLLLRTEVAP